MAVYTEVSPAEAEALLKSLDQGRLVDLQGIVSGIENTNYFLSAEVAGTAHEWVLTVFERLTAEQLPYYLQLMKHLADQGLPVPRPCARPGRSGADALVLTLKDKPAALVERLRGQSVAEPDAAQCAAMGALLARMHLAARDFELRQPNLRGLAWCSATAPGLQAHLPTDQWALLQSELAYQHHVAAQSTYRALPRGPVHADLFRDNTLFTGVQPSAVFDFYFAGDDTWLFDLAVCLNDWCVAPDSGSFDPERLNAFVQAYQTVRPLAAAERALLGAMLRAAALRFWLSRLGDWHQPREASLLQPKDPRHFEQVLRARATESLPWL